MSPPRKQIEPWQGTVVECAHMSGEESSRRLFLLRSATGLSAAWLAAALPEILAAHEHARQAAASPQADKLEFFAPGQAADVEAIAAQIIPTDDTPGAREARVLYFIDRALTTFDRDKKELYTKGLNELQAALLKKFPGPQKFSELDSAQQVELLKAIEKTEFFEAVRTHTVMGFFADPEHGGNYNRAGWKLIGFEDSFVFEPPFGHYDRDYQEGREPSAAPAGKNRQIDRSDDQV